MKPLRNACFVVALAAALPANGMAQCTPPSHLISWWAAENDPTDVQGLNPGALFGNTVYIAGKVGRAFRFDGAKDGVVVGNQGSLQQQSITLEAWLRRTSATVATKDPIAPGLTEGTVGGWGHLGWLLVMRADGALLFTKVDVSEVHTSMLAITDTKWHHVACSYDGVNAVFAVDGVTESLPYRESFGFSTECAIGVRPDTFTNSLLGDLDEVSVYGRALSTAEVQVLTAMTGGKCRPLTSGSLQVSVAAGGVQHFSLDAGVANAGKSYLLLGSSSGTQPGLPFQGFSVPLNPDGYFTVTLAMPSGALLGNALGVLDGFGHASATLTLPPGLLQPLAGVTLQHAFVVFGATLQYVSNPVPTTLVP